MVSRKRSAYLARSAHRTPLKMRFVSLHSGAKKASFILRNHALIPDLQRLSALGGTHTFSKRNSFGADCGWRSPQSGGGLLTQQHQISFRRIELCWRPPLSVPSTNTLTTTTSPLLNCPMSLNSSLVRNSWFFSMVATISALAVSNRGASRHT